MSEIEPNRDYERTGGGLLAEISPPWPFRLASRGGPDLVSRVEAGVWERFLKVDGAPVLVRAWQPGRRPGPVRISAIPVPDGWFDRAAAYRAENRRRAGWPERKAHRFGDGGPPGANLRGVRQRREARSGHRPAAGPGQLSVAIDRARNAIGVDDDYTEFFATYRDHERLGPAIRELAHLRIRRTAWPFEAFAWAITEQLIEVVRAHQIQRRILARWGEEILPPDRRRPLRDIPGPEVFASLAPAELAELDLAPKRAIALIKAAREVASGRIDPGLAEHDRRLTAISEIGPWTVQVLGQKGRGEPDSLPAGDLAYVKLVPRLAGMDRRATVAEVNEYFAPHAPFRGWAGYFLLVHHGSTDAGPPLKYHPPNPEWEEMVA